MRRWQIAGFEEGAMQRARRCERRDFVPQLKIRQRHGAAESVLLTFEGVATLEPLQAAERQPATDVYDGYFV
jgi:hypothetical protein